MKELLFIFLWWILTLMLILYESPVEAADLMPYPNPSRIDNFRGRRNLALI